jgi:hypothetical protein
MRVASASRLHPVLPKALDYQLSQVAFLHWKSPRAK